MTRSVSRIAILFAIILFVTGSLITFPAGLPWMILIWILIGLIIAKRNRTPWHILAVALTILVIKNPEFTAMLLAMLAGLLATTVFYFRRRHAKSQPCWPIMMLAAIACSFMLDFKLAATRTVQKRDSDRIAIACLGDSLTDCGYPQELKGLIHNPVLDYGRNGITSADGVKLIDQILAKNPRVLVLELGGHDYNQGKSRRETYDNLSRIIEKCVSHEVLVVLVEIPRGFVRDPFRGLERQLAREHDLELIPDTLIRKFVLFSSICPPGTWMSSEHHLSDDGLHPNDKGNRLFARTVADRLAKILGDKILRAPVR